MPPRKHPYRPLFPKAAEARYARLLRAWAAGISRRMEAALKPELDKARAIEEHLARLHGDGFRADDAATWDLSAFLHVVERYLSITPAPPDPTPVGHQVVLFSDGQQKRMLSRVYSLDTMRPLDERGLVDPWVKRNVALIQTIPERYHDDLVRVIKQAHAEGMTTDRLAKILPGRGEVSEARAYLIARDQVGKLNGQVVQERQTGLGIAGYLWSNSKDERVVGNPSGAYPEATDPTIHGNHWEREGQFFTWESPPEDGPPGDAIQCRCTPLAVLPGESPDDVRAMYGLTSNSGVVGGAMSQSRIEAIGAKF